MYVDIFFNLIFFFKISFANIASHLVFYITYMLFLLVDCELDTVKVHYHCYKWYGILLANKFFFLSIFKRWACILYRLIGSFFKDPFLFYGIKFLTNLSVWCIWLLPWMILVSPYFQNATCSSLLVKRHTARKDLRIVLWYDFYFQESKQSKLH